MEEIYHRRKLNIQMKQPQHNNALYSHKKNTRYGVPYLYVQSQLLAGKAKKTAIGSVLY